jgi:hypothetical protein
MLPPPPAVALFSTNTPQRHVRIFAETNILAQSSNSAEMFKAVTNILQASNSAEMFKALQNLSGVATSNLDFVELTLSKSVANLERDLNDPDPITRKVAATMLEDRRKQLAEYRTNAQLWANLHQAKESGNAEKTSRASQELADYLAARLGSIQKKTYPPGMSLDAVMKEYRIHYGFKMKTGLTN